MRLGNDTSHGGRADFFARNRGPPAVRSFSKKRLCRFFEAGRRARSKRALRWFIAGAGAGIRLHSVLPLLGQGEQEQGHPIQHRRRCGNGLDLVPLQPLPPGLQLGELPRPGIEPHGEDDAQGQPGEGLGLFRPGLHRLRLLSLQYSAGQGRCRTEICPDRV